MHKITFIRYVITFIRYAQNRKIGKPNNVKVFGAIKPKQDRLKSL
jgi:hypothetical protein